jgi:hypothetical protein
MTAHAQAQPAQLPPVVALVGATGTGKSDLAIAVAKGLVEKGVMAEVINADAMQLYRGMDVGTAKLPEAERQEFPTTFSMCGMSAEKPVSLTTKHSLELPYERSNLGAVCRFSLAGPVCMSHLCSTSLSFREPTRRCGPGWRHGQSPRVSPLCWRNLRQKIHWPLRP